jgi:hypothetical protein
MDVHRAYWNAVDNTRGLEHAALVHDPVLSGTRAWHESGGFRNGGAVWRGGDRRLSRPAVRPPKPAAPFQFLVLLMAGWIHRRQQLAMAYRQAENRVLRERLGTGRLRFTDAERRLLAEKGEALGRTLLAELATLATPETILRWYLTKLDAFLSASLNPSQLPPPIRAAMAQAATHDHEPVDS